MSALNGPGKAVMYFHFKTGNVNHISKIWKKHDSHLLFYLQQEARKGKMSICLFDFLFAYFLGTV